MPRYTVETLDGEMEYGSLEQLRQAVEIGLVSPDALVNEDGGFHGRPAGKVVTRPGSGVKSALRTIPIPTPVPSYALFALALLALFGAELPRLGAMVPALGKLPTLPMEPLPRPEGWPPSIGWPAALGWPQLAAAALLGLTFLRGLFAAAPQSAVFFAALGAYLAATDRMELALPCFAAAVTVSVLGVRRLRYRRSAASGL